MRYFKEVGENALASGISEGNILSKIYICADVFCTEKAEIALDNLLVQRDQL